MVSGNLELIQKCMKKLILTLVCLSLLSFPILQGLAFDPNHRFTDQELDSESGLYNFKAREYSPNTGKFIQSDPVLVDGSFDHYFLNNASKEKLEEVLVNPQRLNYYSYANNNPVKYVDPTGEDPLVWDYTTDVFFFNQSLADYQENNSFGNAVALAADTIGLLPIIPAGTGGLFKRFFNGLNYLSDICKEILIFSKAEKLKNVYGIANFANRGQLLENFNKHKGSLGDISLKEYSNKAQDLYKRFINKDSNILSGIKGSDTVLFDVKTNEFSVVTLSETIKTYFIPNVRDKLKYFKRNIEY